VWDLVNSDEPYPEALPILLAHLQRPYPGRVREGIARALAVRDARFGWDVLIRLYEEEPGDSDAKKGLAAAIAAASDDEVLDDVIAMANDARHGESRLLLLRALERSKKPRAKEALTELSGDPSYGILKLTLRPTGYDWQSYLRPDERARTLAAPPVTSSAVAGYPCGPGKGERPQQCNRQNGLLRVVPAARARYGLSGCWAGPFVSLDLPRMGCCALPDQKLDVTANPRRAGSVVAKEPNRDTSQTARSCQTGLGEWTDRDSAQTAQQLRPSPPHDAIARCGRHITAGRLPTAPRLRLRGQGWKRIPQGSSLHRRRLRLLEHVVVERLLEDRRVDQADDVLEGAQAGGIDHGLRPSPRGDDAGSPLVPRRAVVPSGTARVPRQRVQKAAKAAGSCR